jgi:hypothetical protein
MTEHLGSANGLRCLEEMWTPLTCHNPSGPTESKDARRPSSSPPGSDDPKRP